MILFPPKKLSRNDVKWLLLIFSVLFGFYLHLSGILINLIEIAGNFGIVGILIAGIFYVYAFTVAPATALIIFFANNYNPILVSFLGAVGAMVGNLVIFNFFKKELPDELENLIKKTKIDKLRKSKFKGVVPGIGGFIITSPLPDEVGVSILGMAKFSTNQFMALSFILHFIGLSILTVIVWLI